MSRKNDTPTDKELLDYSKAELWEWAYEIREIKQEIARDGDKVWYEYTAILEQVGERGSVGPRTYSRFYRSKEKNDWRYEVGDKYITKLVGPVGQ